MIKCIRVLLIVIGSWHSMAVMGQQPWDYDDHQLSLKIPELSLLAIAPANEVIKLGLGIPGFNGGTGQGSSSTNEKTWINYTSTIEPQASYKRILVQITSGEIPAGLVIELSAHACSTGNGVVGTASSTIELSNTQQSLVTGIGGAKTGKGKDYGHKLKYELKLSDLNQLEFEESQTYITVTYTISD